MQSVSVAVCTYNGAKYLEKQIESIFNQKFLPSEIIVSDDGSSDKTVSLLMSLQCQAPTTMRVIAGKTNLGVSRNFERAIAACSGSIISLADQDDIWRSDKIEAMIDAFDANPDCGYVFSDACLIDDGGVELGKGLWETIGFSGARRSAYERGDQLRVMLRGGNFVYGTTLAFRSQFKELLLPFLCRSSECTHDTWIATILSAAGHRGVSLCEKLISYRQHTDQVVGAGQFRASSWQAMHRVLQTNKRPDCDLADDYGLLADRVQEFYGMSSSITMLRGKALHLRRRREIIEYPRTSRIPAILAELLSMRYSKYSSSWFSALRDIVN